MTKTAAPAWAGRAPAAVALALLAFALVPAPAAAHGAPEARAIDTRVLADDDGMLAFGGCVPEAGCQADGIDLLALDVREAADAQGRPMVVLRFVFQSELASLAGASVAATFTAGGQERTVTVALADGNATSAEAARVEGPAAVGDGHVRAVDAWLLAEPLGLKPGDQVSGIRVRSAAGEDGAADLMPGTWSTGGQAVPFVPHEPAVPAEPAPGNYTVAGPARLVNATGPAQPVAAHHAAATATVTVQSAVALAQFATLRLEATGVNATLDTATLNLPDTAAKTVTVTVADATPGARLDLVVATDLGGFVRVPIPLSVEPGHRHGGEPDPQPAATTEPAPALAPGLTLAALAALALLRRR